MKSSIQAQVAHSRGVHAPCPPKAVLGSAFTPSLGDARTTGCQARSRASWFPAGRTPVNGRDNSKTTNETDAVSSPPVLKHGPNIAFGGNARERAYDLSTVLRRLCNIVFLAFFGGNASERAYVIGTFLSILAVASMTVAAEPAFDAAARAKAVAPFVEDGTLVVARVDLTRIASQPAFDFVKRLWPYAPLDVTSGVAAKRLDSMREAGMKEFYLVGPVGGGLQPRMLMAIPIASNDQEKAIRTVLDLQGNAARTTSGALVFVTPSQNWRESVPPKEFHPVDRPELAAAFQAAGDTAVQIVLVASPDSRRVAEELMPQLPAWLGGGPCSTFTRGVRWAAVGMNFPPHESMRLVVQSSDAATAESLRIKLAEVLKSIGQLKKVREVVPKYDEVAALLAPTVEGDRLVLDWNETNRGMEKLVETVEPHIDQLRAAATRGKSVNNLKQLGLAMHNYAQANKQFPLPVSRGPDGKPLLSWRVMILPFIDGTGLYKQFHLDEPWHSEHNRKLIAKMPEIYRLPTSKTERGRTNYLLPVGGGAAFDTDKQTLFKDFKDGLSNTIMIVEVDDSHAVEWTKPDDWAFDPKEPAKGLGRFFDGGFNATICDGSVLLIAWPQSPKDIGRLRALFTRDGGEVME